LGEDGEAVGQRRGHAGRSSEGKAGF
jgi:hypothetical protein